MKRILVMTVLAVLLVSAFGATTAVAAKHKTVVTGKLYAATDVGISYVLGTVTFHTDTGAWTITQNSKAGLPPTTAGYDLGVTTSRPVHGAFEGATIMTDTLIFVQPDGTISQSGQVVDPAVVETINADLANGGVFVLLTNSQ